MRNRRAIAAVVSSSLLLCVAVIACTSDNGKSTFNETQPDGSFDAGATIFNPDATTPPTADGPIVCNPSLPTNFDPQWIAPTPDTVCSATDIQAYYDTCLANDAKGNPQFNTKVCTDWIAQHGACGKCIEKDDNSSPIQVFRNRLYYTLNNAGCIAIEQGDFANSSCGAKYDAATQCRRDSCDRCFEQSGAQFSDFIACQSAAEASACGQFNSASNAACVGYKTAGGDGGVPQCFPLTDAGTQEDTRSFYIRVMGYFCTAK